ncbi:hypothetical protein [Actinoallomurus sp. NPDC050550]|uniref:hypothetical protein n=1 Tax=Actinoallomurus sp. NPDC050550 TaxID=3154937 RepID=UPI0033CC959A
MVLSVRDNTGDLGIAASGGANSVIFHVWRPRSGGNVYGDRPAAPGGPHDQEGRP